MSDIPEEPIGANQLLDEATLWFARMRGPEAAEHRPAFEAWLARGALHRGAYNHAAEIFSFGKFLAEEAQVPADPEDAPHPAPLSKRRRLLVSVALCCTVLIGLWGLSHFGRPDRVDLDSVVAAAPPTERVLRTASGEGRVERLEDGSVLTLGPDTRLSVRYDKKQRLLVLTQGRARFEVAKEQRPFIVTALGTRVTAHGTVFDVRISARSDVTVSLIEGRIDVVTAARAGKPQARRSLIPGQSVELAGESAQAATAPTAGTPLPAQPPSQEALHEYDAARLADVVADANRVGQVPILLAGETLGELRISGRFRLDDSAKLAQRIGAVFNLSVNRDASGHILLRRR